MYVVRIFELIHIRTYMFGLEACGVVVTALWQISRIRVAAGFPKGVCCCVNTVFVIDMIQNDLSLREIYCSGRSGFLIIDACKRHLFIDGKDHHVPVLVPAQDTAPDIIDQISRRLVVRPIKG